MAARDVFSEEELAQLRGFPKVNQAELIRYFALTPADNLSERSEGPSFTFLHGLGRPVRARR